MKKNQQIKLKHKSMIEVQENGENLKALLFLTLGSKYLNLVHNVLDECVKSGNLHIVSFDLQQGFDEYFRKTKWSDFMIIEPVLFNFYHGLELTLKGLLFLTNQSDVKAVHGLTGLYERIDRISTISPDLKKILKDHLVVDKLNNPLIDSFLTENKITVDQLYESLRYPSNRRFDGLNKYIELHYQETRSLEYFKKVMSDIREIQKIGVTLYRETTKTGYGGVSIT